MNQYSKETIKILFRQLFAGAGIIVLAFAGLFSYGDHPLFDFSSVHDFIEGLFRLGKTAALIGMAYALVRIWMEGYENSLEVENLRRRLEERQRL